MGKIRRKSKSRNYSKRCVSQKVKRSKIRRKSKTRNSSKRRVSQKVKRKSLRKIRKQKRMKRSTQKGGWKVFPAAAAAAELDEMVKKMNDMVSKDDVRGMKLLAREKGISYARLIGKSSPELREMIEQITGMGYGVET